MKLARITALLIVLPSLALAQQKVVRQVHGFDPDAPSTLRFEMPAGADEVSIPFQVVNEHLILPVTVQGAGPFRVVLDTGMPMEGLMLHGDERVDALKLPYLPDVKVQVAGAGGEGASKPAQMADGIALEIGPLKVEGMRVTVLPRSGGFAAYHDGVIGAALFRHFAVTIDNDRKVVTLRRPEAYHPPDGAAVVPLTLDRGLPFVHAAIGLGSPAPVPVTLVVDLGASHVVSLNAGDDGRIAIPSASIAAPIGRGLSGEITGRVGRIASLELGGLTLRDVVATFPDSAFHAPRGLDERNGNLGAGALSRFNLTFDYAGKRLVLQPSRRFSDPFEWDMSGISAEPTGAGSVTVREVVPGSPAADAGIREGDAIVKVDGQPVTEAGWFELRERLRQADHRVPLEVRRGDEVVDVTLTLRRLV